MSGFEVQDDRTIRLYPVSDVEIVLFPKHGMIGLRCESRPFPNSDEPVTQHWGLDIQQARKIGSELLNAAMEAEDLA